MFVDEINKIIIDITQSLPNVSFLQQSIIYNRVRFLGCTLWSMEDSKLTSFMNDFTMIKDMTAEKYMALHVSDLNWKIIQMTMIKQ